MTAWTREDPGGGDLDGLDALVDRLCRHLDALVQARDEVVAVGHHVAAGWTGQGAQAWQESTTARTRQLTTSEDLTRRGAGAVAFYSGQVRVIRSRASIVHEDITFARAAVRRATEEWDRVQHDPLADDWDRRMALMAVQRTEQELIDADAVLDRLALERQALDDGLAPVLESVVPVTWSGGGRVTAECSVDAFGRGIPGMAAWVAGLPEGAQGDAAARWLVGQLTQGEYDALLAACPELACRLMADDTTGAFAVRYPGLDAAIDLADPDARIAAVLAACAAMTPEELAGLTRAYPGVVNNLDGVPLATRIAANRVAVAAAVVDANRRLAEVRERMTQLATGAGPDDLTELSRLSEQKVELEASLAWYDTLLHEPDIDTVDAEGNPMKMTGHHVVAFDPETGVFGELVGNAGAPNVAVLVGGTGTNFVSMSGQRSRAWEFVSAAPQGLGVITYLGGLMPQGVHIENPRAKHAFEAVDPAYAKSAGPRLASFANGVRAVTGATVTVAGHSYGGSVVGAAEAHGMVVDRILHIESAGAGPGIHTPDQYAAPNTPRYSMTAPGDVIGIIQGTSVSSLLGHGADPDTLPGVTHLETGRIDSTDPTSELLQGPSSHSQVFTRGSDAWNNMRAVMTGGDVTLWTDPDLAHATGAVDPQYTYPMQDPTYVPPTADVP